MDGETLWIQHPRPVWRDEADTILGIAVPNESRPIVEQLWGQRRPDGTFRICCIPFFAKDLALGDLVEAPDFHLSRVVQPSGRYVFRIWVEGPNADGRSLIDELERRSILFELRGRLIAVDTPDLDSAERLSAWLAEGEAAGRFTYETGKT